MAASVLTVADPDIRSAFPDDQAEADALATEILRAFVANKQESPDMRIENRPDWQEKFTRSRQEWVHGDVVQHEDVLEWERRQS